MFPYQLWYSYLRAFHTLIGGYMIKAKSKLKQIYQPPGSATYTGMMPEDGIYVERTIYNEDSYRKDNLTGTDLVDSAHDAVTWLDIRGLTQADHIEDILRHHQIGKMTIEDVLHIGQRAKVDFYNNYIYIVLMMLTYNEDLKDVHYEQVSFILKDNLLITLQEQEGDVFGQVRSRLMIEKSAIRRKPADYLLYSLLDAIVDHYFILLSTLEDKIEAFESVVINHPRALKLKDLYLLRNRISHIKTTVEPLKEVFGLLIHEDSSLNDSTKLYFKDIQDHIDQIVDYTLTYREMISNIYDTFLSMNSHRMNQIMTTLTLFSAIFIPLTFLAGVYGMNFKYMPELNSPYGYPVFWILSILISLGLLIFFRVKKWL